MVSIDETVLQQRYRHKGYSVDHEWVVVWRPSTIPYHIVFWIDNKVERWDQYYILSVTNDLFAQDPSTWKDIITPLAREALREWALKLFGEEKMPSNQGEGPWWTPLADESARKQAYRMAAILDQRIGGIQDLNLQDAQQFAREAQDKAVDLAYLEALTVPEPGSDSLPPNKGASEPDTPEVATRLKQVHFQQKLEKIEAVVAGHKVGKLDTEFSITKNSLLPIPENTPIPAVAATTTSSPVHTQQKAASAQLENTFAPIETSNAPLDAASAQPETAITEQQVITTQPENIPHEVPISTRSTLVAQPHASTTQLEAATIEQEATQASIESRTSNPSTVHAQPETAAIQPGIAHNTAEATHPTPAKAHAQQKAQRKAERKAERKAKRKAAAVQQEAAIIQTEAPNIEHGADTVQQKASTTKPEASTTQQEVIAIQQEALNTEQKAPTTKPEALTSQQGFPYIQSPDIQHEAALMEQEPVQEIDEGETTPTQESFGRRARANSVQFIRERTNSRSATTTPSHVTTFREGLGTPADPTGLTATASDPLPVQAAKQFPMSNLSELKALESSWATEVQTKPVPPHRATNEFGHTRTARTLPEQVSSFRNTSSEPLMLLTGQSHEAKEKLAVLDVSLTPSPISLVALISRKTLFRQVQMASRRIVLYQKSAAKHVFTPINAISKAAPTRPVPNANQPGSSEPSRDTVFQFQAITWAYVTHTRADRQMLNLGIMLFQKPSNCIQPPPTTAVTDPAMLDRPVVVNENYIMENGPAAHFNDEEDKIHILPFARPRPDSRAVSKGHPDYLIPSPWRSGLQGMRLSQYEACELFGQQVWRHDRHLLKCRFPGCLLHLSDWNKAQYLCLGCGPKSIVRYCSKEHMLNDANHWEECSSPDLLIKRVIDYKTEPPRWQQFCPAITDCEGYNSLERHRQRNHAMMTAGHYTLFLDPKEDAKTGQSTPQTPFVIQFPKSHPEYQELTSRVERLLSLCFFDSNNKVIPHYLFRLLQYALHLSNHWSRDIEIVLISQMMQEFLIFIAIEDSLPLCECQWSLLTTRQHVSACPSSPKYRTMVGGLLPSSLNAWVTNMEKKYWILRAWRQQHEVKSWKDRVIGKGFKGATMPKRGRPGPYLGEGWECWGAEKTDMHEQWLPNGMRSGDPEPEMEAAREESGGEKQNIGEIGARTSFISRLDEMAMVNCPLVRPLT